MAQADINLDSGALGCIRGRVACFRGTPRKHALTISETFAGTAYTLNSDHSDGTNDAWCRAGNLIDDGQMRYTYDAWNRLVKVTRKQDTDIVIQTAEY
ncbi:MAG: hypothetical protein IT449_16235, partial [Phycisphaerales bacterium]|nr:hypothetical protein [Phycisphaerales bacterium]